ncbi:MAG: nucleotide exchange factor GrpE [Verrucomicrobiota bacterium]
MNPDPLPPDMDSPIQNELIALKESYLRLAADFDNFKKRTRRDSEQRASEEKESFIQDLLPVLDNLERALDSGSSASFEQLHQGVAMTLQQLYHLLRQQGIRVVDDLGRPFDPHRHEAIFVQNDPLHPDHTILKVTQRGYSRGDKVFRPSQVIVNDLNHSSPTSHAY